MRMLVVFLMLLVAPPGWAEAFDGEMDGKEVAAKGDISQPAPLSFWELVRQKIGRLVPKKKLVITTSSAGVRGSMGDADDLYWKGEAKSIDEEEYRAFSSAMSMMSNGGVESAARQFNAFADRYQDSILAKDARQAVMELMQMAR